MARSVAFALLHLNDGATRISTCLYPFDKRLVFCTILTQSLSIGADRNRDRKRRRTDEGVLIEDRLESLISRVGEKVGSSSSSFNSAENILRLCYG